MIFLVLFVFLFNLFIRQGRGDSLLSKVNNSVAFPYASADAPSGGGGAAESAESAEGGGPESSCESCSCESGCAVTSEIS